VVLATAWAASNEARRPSSGLTSPEAPLAHLPFMVWVRRIEVDFVRPALGDQGITITSFVREFRGPDAHIECTMLDEGGKTVSRCLMIVACVDKQTNRSMDWPAEATALFFQDQTDGAT